MDPASLARAESAFAMALMALFLAAVLVWGRLSALWRRRAPLAPARPLTQPELAELRNWERRARRWFVVAMVLIVAYGAVCALARWIPVSLILGAQAVVLGMAFVALAVHFSGRCPLCGRRIGFQSSLVLPLACEICGAVFRPDSPLAGLASSRGIIAVGDVAVGVVAVGVVAAGGIAVGGISLDVLSVGGLSLGIAALGGAAAVWFALGGLALGAYAFGGVAL